MPCIPDDREFVDICCIAGGMPAAGNLGFVAEKEFAPIDVEGLCRVVESCMPNGAFDWEDRVEKVLDCGCHWCDDVWCVCWSVRLSYATRVVVPLWCLGFFNLFALLWNSNGVRRFLSSRTMLVMDLEGLRRFTSLQIS